MLDFGCIDVGFWLCGSWILIASTLFLIAWTLDFIQLGEFWLCRRWNLFFGR